MKLLRETVRSLILQEILKRRTSHVKEQPTGPCAAANSMIQKGIQTLEKFDLEIHHYQGMSGMRVIVKLAGENTKVGILKATQDPYALEGKCNDGWMVEWSKIEEDMRGTGLGALMYDVALELVGEAGLMADRNQVSEDAIRNWNYFYSSNDYIKKPLDTKSGSYTDDPSDDCAAESYRDYDLSSWTHEIYATGLSKEQFQAHPLNNVFVKKDQSQPTITCLQGMRRIRERG